MTTATAVPRRHRFRPATLVAAAAAAIALVGGVTVWQAQDDLPGQEQQLSAADRVLAAPDAEEYRKTLPDGTEVTLVRSPSRNEAVLVAEGMPPAPEGKVYELWLAHEDVGMVPAGTMRGTEEQVVLEGDPATAIGAGITVEPAPGSEEPTTQPLTTFAFDSA